MSNSSAISSISTYLLTSTQINNNQTLLNNLSSQLSTGQAETSLEAYGNQAQTVLSIASSTQTENAYVQNNTVVNTYLGAYSDALSQLQTDATTLQGALQSFSINEPSSVTNLQNVLSGVITDVQATLNSQVGTRYIFAGTDSRLTTQPVTYDLASIFNAQATTNLPNASSSPVTSAASFASSFLPSTSADLPFYDTQYPNSTTTATSAPLAYPQPAAPASASTATDAFGTQTVTTSDNEQMTFGISSDDPTIQSLVYAMQTASFAVYQAQQANQATSTTTADALQANANTLVGNALDAVNIALNGTADTQISTGNGVTVSGLTDLEEQVGNQQATLSNINDVHTQTLANLATQKSDIETVNSSTVAEEISALENQLNASYKVTSSILNMSILTYL